MFVTGGSGYIGRHVVRALVARGDTVWALARSDTARTLLEHLGATVIMGDITDGEALCDGMRDCQAVIHCAAMVTHWGDPLDFHRINVDGTRQVILACQAMDVSRLIFLSSVAVLADGTLKIHIDETTPYAHKPIGLYPLTKAIAERLVQTANTDDLQTVVIRTHFVWGGDNQLGMSALVNSVESGHWAWMNHGQHLVSTCHVGNLTEGVMRALERGRGGHCYFITDGAPIEYRNFVSNLLKTQGLSEPDGHISGRWAMWRAWITEIVIRRLTLATRPQLTRTQVALMRHELTINDNKARNELGYQGRITREDGMADIARRKRDTSFG